MSNQPNNNDENVFDIPVRINDQMEHTEDMIHRLQEEEKEAGRIIGEYEQHYYGNRSQARSEVYYEDTPEKQKNDGWWSTMTSRADDFKLPPRHRYPSRAVKAHAAENEKFWAAMAHGNAILTLLFALGGGPAVVIPLLVPLAIYFYYRRRSEYVAFHSLQAFTLQVVGTIGVMIVLLSGIILLGILIAISALFSLVLIGIPFLILFGLLFVAFVVTTLAMPFVMVIYGVIAAFAAYNGRNYRYPYIADWVDDQLENGMFGITI
ncbi:MAG: DUF4870 domain-containing protein [Chloroflexi bacterium]|nr:DUF4870 domain-containing protein [Chloroflexota bacterium]